jgi:hypothetical protein
MVTKHYETIERKIHLRNREYLTYLYSLSSHFLSVPTNDGF